MIRKTTWSPDTCECVLEFEWDDAVDPEMRTHSVSQVKKTCADHEGIASEGVQFTSVMAENKTKNQVMKKVMDDFPDLVDEVVDENGGVSKKFKPGIKYEYSFKGKGENRSIEVDFVGVDVLKKSQIKASLSLGGFEKGLNVKK